MKFMSPHFLIVLSASLVYDSKKLIKCQTIKTEGDDNMLELDELKRSLMPYGAKLIEMGNSL